MRKLIVAFFSLLALSAAAAPIAIPEAGLVYSQNFDTLGNVANNGLTTTPWTDDSTLPGWWLYRAGNGTPLGFAGSNYLYNVADGSATISGGNFMSLGDNGGTDRALGNPSSTAQGEMSAIVTFQNTSALTMELTELRHSLEVRRTNQNAGSTETLFVWSRTASSLPALFSWSTAPATSAIFPSAVASTPGSHYITGWNRHQDAEITYVGGGIGFTQVNELIPQTTVPVGRILIPPGQYFALRFSNINDIGTDHLMGVDDLQITFKPLTASITATVSNVIRFDNGTPTVTGDDFVNFTLDVSGAGGVDPAGWTVASPPALAGLTGTYGVPRTFSGVSISSFTGPDHALDLLIVDRTTASVGTEASVIPPWCQLTPQVSAVTRDDKGTPLIPTDDTWGYTVTVNAVYASVTCLASVPELPGALTYGTAYTVNDLPLLSPRQTITFTDTADPLCTATVTASAPRIIGTNLTGSPRPIYTDAAGLPPGWVADEAELSQTLSNAGGPPASMYRSERITLAPGGAYQFSAILTVTDTSSGFEATDFFGAALILDGNELAPLSLVSPYDTNGDGILSGAELAPGPGTFTYALSVIIPANATSIQFAVTGTTNSASEFLSVSNVELSRPAHSIQAAIAGTFLDNKNTENQADDEFVVDVVITPVNAPAASTGWVSNSTPASGLYQPAGTVRFGPFAAAFPTQPLIITDNGNPAISTTLLVSAPPPSISLSIFSFVRHHNGPGPADDTGTAEVLVFGFNGGPRFTIASDPASVSPGSLAFNEIIGGSATIQFNTLPLEGEVPVTVRDSSYPGASQTLRTLIPSAQPPATGKVIARQNLRGSLSDIYENSAVPVPAAWISYPGIPALELTNGGAGGTPFESQIVDLTGINGPVQFTGTLRARDRSSGFEPGDYFTASLAIRYASGPPTAVELDAGYDRDGNSVINGGLDSSDDEFNTAQLQDGNYVSDFALSHLIPDDAISVQLIISARNDSASETFILRDCLFALATPQPITPGSHLLALNPGVSGKVGAATLIALATGGSGPLSVSAVQPGLTPRGATVSLQDGWLIYEPRPGAGGIDVFDYTLTDGTQTATGRVAVTIRSIQGVTFNIAGILPEAGGYRVAAFGIPGRAYVWSYSDDLQSWWLLGGPAQCPPSGALTILDTSPKLPPARYYRLQESLTLAPPP